MTGGAILVKPIKTSNIMFENMKEFNVSRNFFCFNWYIYIQFRFTTWLHRLTIYFSLLSLNFLSQKMWMLSCHFLNKFSIRSTTQCMCWVSQFKVTNHFGMSGIWRTDVIVNFIDYKLCFPLYIKEKNGYVSIFPWISQKCKYDLEWWASYDSIHTLVNL